MVEPHFTNSQDFDALATAIADIHVQMCDRAIRAVNHSLTIRNWMFGAFIYAFELNGLDRAAYGEQLFDKLAERLSRYNIPRTDARELRRYLRFYRAYPEIRDSLSPELLNDLPTDTPVEKRESLTPKISAHTEALLRLLSFTHFVALIEVESLPKRRFYEEQAIEGQWSVRELRRQISSLLFERTAIAIDRGNEFASLPTSTNAIDFAAVVRDPYVFEFLGFQSHNVLPESQLERALLDRIQTFLLELGRGFCFEAKQKRINIGGDLFFIDLVFYHRLLKCHVLVELKVDEFRHEHLGQLNTYVNWYRKHEMQDGDNPPVGLLLCTRKNEALIEYALAGMDNQLFVSKYLLELPEKVELQRLLETELQSFPDEHSRSSPAS